MNEMREVFQYNNEGRGVSLQFKSKEKPKLSITPNTTSSEYSHSSVIMETNHQHIHMNISDPEEKIANEVDHLYLEEKKDVDTLQEEESNERVEPVRGSKKSDTGPKLMGQLLKDENFLQHFNDNYEDLLKAIMHSSKKSVSLKGNDMPRVFLNNFNLHNNNPSPSSKTGKKDKFVRHKNSKGTHGPKSVKPIVAEFISQAYKNEEEMKNMTNTQEISDFYEYTEECMKRIRKLKVTPDKEIESLYVELPFEKEIKQGKKKLAIFDLDETLVHCVVKKNKKSQHMLEINLPSKGKATVGLNVRPLWRESLEEIKKNYFIIVYTASHQSYADSVIDFLDPNKELIEHRLYRHNCVKVITEGGDSIYVKDLRIFKNISLKDMIIIDNSILSFAFHLENGIPIVPYYENQTDTELKFLSYFLTAVAQCQDLRVENKKNMRLDYFYEKAQHEEFEMVEDESVDVTSETEIKEETPNNQGSTGIFGVTPCESSEGSDVKSEVSDSPDTRAMFKRQSSKRVSVFQGEFKNTLNEMKKHFTNKLFTIKPTLEEK